MRLPSGERSTEWVKRLPSVVAALNGEVTQLTDKKPSDAIKAKTLTQKPSSFGLKEKKVPSGVGVRFLYQPGELEDGRRRATDPVWSLELYRLGRSVTKPDEPVLYYLHVNYAPQRGFVPEELWLVGFGFNGPLRQYFSLYRAVSQREGEREERMDESENVQTTPTRTYCKRNRPLPYCNQNCRTPRHWKFTQHHACGAIRHTVTTG